MLMLNHACNKIFPIDALVVYDGCKNIVFKVLITYVQSYNSIKTEVVMV